MPGKLLKAMQRDQLREAARRPRPSAPIAAPKLVDLLAKPSVEEQIIEGMKCFDDACAETDSDGRTDN